MKGKADNFVRSLHIFPLLIPIYSIALILANESWAYNPIGWVDHWAYFGIAYYFPKINELYPGVPSTELVPVYIFDAILNNIFSPVGARFIRAAVFLGTGMLLVWNSAMIATKNASISIICSIMYGSYLYTLSAIGSNYVEGYVQIFLLGSVVCMLKLLDCNDSKNERYMYLYGACVGLLICSAIMSVLYVAIQVAVLSLAFKKTAVNKIIELLNKFLCGFLAVILFATMVLYKTNGQIPIINNVRKLLYFVGGAYEAPSYDLWASDASWLIFPSSVVICIAVILILRTFKKDVFYVNLNEPIANKYLFFLILIYALLFFVNFVVKQWSLQFLYFGQTTGLYFIAVAIVLNSLIGSGRKISRVEIVLVAFCSIAIVYVAGLSEHSFNFIKSYFPINRYAPIFILSFLFSVLLLLSPLKTPFRWGFLILFFGFNMYSYSPTFGCLPCADGARKYLSLPQGVVSNRNVFKTTLAISDKLDWLDYERTAKVWFSNEKLGGDILRQVFAMNYINHKKNIINKSFPYLVDFSGPIGSEGTPPQKGDRILSIHLDGEYCELGFESLTKLGVKPIHMNNYSYDIYGGQKLDVCEYRL